MPQKLEIAPNTVFDQWTVIGRSKDPAKAKKDILNAVVLAELFLMFLGTHLLAGKVNHEKSVGMQDQRLLN